LICLPPATTDFVANDAVFIEGAMFSIEERESLRSSLLNAAAIDRRLSGAAITGSAATGNEDQWSDIDLAFGVVHPDEMSNVLSDWTERMYGQYRAVHHFDVLSGVWVYRVFLLPDTLQVDLAFAPANDFRALGTTFSLVFGTAAEPKVCLPPKYEEIVGLGWLYALHARSCIARQKLWRAEYMISAIRDNALALACFRHGLPVAHGRGLDQLPRGIAYQFEGSLVRCLEVGELARAFRVAIYGLLSEIRYVDSELADRLNGSLMSLTDRPTMPLENSRDISG
jgi:hypothetical protein